jgi:hypothetical protein
MIPSFPWTAYRDRTHGTTRHVCATRDKKRVEVQERILLVQAQKMVKALTEEWEEWRMSS